MRFALTAQTVARDRMLGTPHTEITKLNMAKVGKYRGFEAFEEQVAQFVEMERNGQKGTTDPNAKEKVYTKGLRDNRQVVSKGEEVLHANRVQVLFEVARSCTGGVDSIMTMVITTRSMKKTIDNLWLLRAAPCATNLFL